MADVHTKAIRSFNMSQIRSKNTKPELAVRKYLHAQGLRFRIHVANLPGKPDIVLRKYRTAIFVHGCFWHGHNCDLFRVPKSNTSWWLKKISKNKANDRLNRLRLKQLDWKVIEVWECQLRSKVIEENLSNCHKKLTCDFSFST